MKKIFVYLLFIGIAVSTISCNKEDTLIGYWKINSTTQNGRSISAIEGCPYNPGNFFAFFSEKSLSISALINNTWYESTYGAWELKKNGKKLDGYFVLRSRRYDFSATVEKLTKRRLKIQFTDNHGDKWIIEFDSRSNY